MNENTYNVENRGVIRRYQQHIKPFTHCYQCRRSFFAPCDKDGKAWHELRCKKPRCRSAVITGRESIAGCPFAERYSIKDILKPECLEQTS